MHQISFAQLPTAEETTFSSDKPLIGSATYEEAQRITKLHQKLERAESQIPVILSMDQWYLEEYWESGYQNNAVWIFGHWAWRMVHTHTGLLSNGALTIQGAIDNAIQLAFFYELLPVKDLILIDSTQKRGLLKVPSFMHYYQYHPATAAKWREEYHSRHPEEKQT